MGNYFAQSNSFPDDVQMNKIVPNKNLLFRLLDHVLSTWFRVGLGVYGGISYKHAVERISIIQEAEVTGMSLRDSLRSPWPQGPDLQQDPPGLRPGCLRGISLLPVRQEVHGVGKTSKKGTPKYFTHIQSFVFQQLCVIW